MLQRFKEAALMEIDRPLTSGDLIKSDEPTDWCAHGFFVPKKGANFFSLSPFTIDGEWWGLVMVKIIKFL